MVTRLVACGGCERHVRVTEVACPFCGQELAELAAREVPSLRGLSRSRRMALGAALSALALPACGGPPTPETPDDNIAQPYGVPPDPEPQPEDNIAPPYGVPPQEEPESRDPEAMDAGAPQTLYGLPAQPVPVPEQ